MDLLTLLLCCGLFAAGVYRLLRVPIDASAGWWAMTQVCLLTAAAKLTRTPGIADRFGDPFLYKITGCHNLMTLAGMTLGALVSIPAVVLTLTMVGHQPAWWPWGAAQAGIASSMVIAFISSPIPNQPVTSYLTASLSTPWPTSVWIYWTIFLSTIAVAGVVNMILALRAFTVVRHGPFGFTLLGWAMTGALACLYVVNKTTNIVFEGIGYTDNAYIKHVPTISLLLLLLLVICLAVTISIYPAQHIPNRCRRYRMLRRSVRVWERERLANPAFALPGVQVPRYRRIALWRGARDPLTAYSLQVELADARLVNSRP